MFREVALCLQPLPRYIYVGKDNWVKSSAGLDFSEATEIRNPRKTHKLREELLSQFRLDEDPDAGIGEQKVASVNEPVPPDIHECAKLYKHRIYTRVESSYSEILASGGLGGFWRCLYDDGIKNQNSISNLIYNENEIEDNFSLPPVSSNHLPPRCRDRILELTNDIHRVLQPLCLLLPAPLPETFSFVACHDTLAELVKVEIEPMEIDDNFGEEIIDPIVIDLLMKFKEQFSKFLIIRHFNNESTDRSFRFGEGVEEAGAVLHRLATPFVLMCPLGLNGKALDIEFVVNSLRLSILTSIIPRYVVCSIVNTNGQCILGNGKC